MSPQGLDRSAADPRSTSLSPLLRSNNVQPSNTISWYDELLSALLRRDLVQAHLLSGQVGAARARTPPPPPTLSPRDAQTLSILRTAVLQNEARQATNNQRLLLALAQCMAGQAPVAAPAPARAVDASTAVLSQLYSMSSASQNQLLERLASGPAPLPALSGSSASVGSFPVAVVSIPSSVRDSESQDSSSLSPADSRSDARGASRRSRSMANSRDLDTLSEYQCLLREQMEFFQATPEDTKVTAQGRNRPIFLGQVGIQCRHCAHHPAKQRRRGAVYFPARLSSIYQSAQNMGTNHFNGRCPNIPDSVGEHLGTLKTQKSFNHGGGKIYWADKAATAGVVELDDGLVFG